MQVFLAEEFWGIFSKNCVTRLLLEIKREAQRAIQHM